MWDHHITAWKAQDLPAILADYSEDSVVIVNNRLYRGRNQIGRLFEGLFTLFGRAEEHIIDPAVVEGKIVFITWRVTVDGVHYNFQSAGEFFTPT